MKYLKEHKDFDWNDEDFDFEEESDVLNGKYLIFKYNSNTIIQYFIGIYNTDKVILLSNTGFEWFSNKKSMCNYFLTPSEISKIKSGEYHIRTAGYAKYYEYDQIMKKYNISKDNVDFVDEEVFNQINNVNESIDWDEDWDEEEYDNSNVILDFSKGMPDVEISEGDKVTVIYDSMSLKATVIKSGKYNTLQFDEFMGGHDGGCDGKQGHCWNFSFDNPRDVRWLLDKLERYFKPNKKNKR